MALSHDELVEKRGEGTFKKILKTFFEKGIEKG